MIKFHNALLACALGAGSLLGAAAPASAAHLSVVATRPAASGRVLPDNRYYGTAYPRYGYRYGYPYRAAYGYPYGYGVTVGVGYVGGAYGSVGAGYGYGGPGYGYAPYPAVYARRAYSVRRPYWRPYRRAGRIVAR